MTPSLENVYSSHTFLSKAIGQKDLLGLKVWNAHSSAERNNPISPLMLVGKMQTTKHTEVPFSSPWLLGSVAGGVGRGGSSVASFSSWHQKPLNKKGENQEGTGMLSLTPAPY